MAKAPIQIYVRVARDSCRYPDPDEGYAPCAGVQADHGFHNGIYNHNFVAGDTAFVYPTDAERRKIYKQLKDEFDG